MKLTVPRSELKEALAGLAKVITPRAPVPILSCLRLDAEGKAVRLTGTDLHQVATYETSVAEPVRSPLSVLIPLEALQAVLKTAHGPDVSIEPGDASVTLTATVVGQGIGRRVEVPPVEDWPSLPTAVETQPVESGFGVRMRQAMAFASPDDSRPMLKSVYLDVGIPSAHKLVATDSRRLNVFPCGLLPLAESVIVPSTKFLNGAKLEGETRIGAGKGVFTLRCGPWTYTVKQVEGPYPRWSQVVPAYNGARTLDLSPEDAALLVQALPSLPNYDGSREAVVLSMEGKAIRVFSRQDAKSPESAIRLANSQHEGAGAFSIGLNREYIREALQAGFRHWEFRDAASPMLGRMSKEDKSSLHVLMPIRTIDAAVQGAGTPVPEVTPVPVQPQPLKETPRMIPKPEEAPSTPEPSSLDKILAAYEAAKSAVRQAQTALADVASCVRDAIREDKVRSREVADVRAGLAKLQAIRV